MSKRLAWMVGLTVLIVAITGCSSVLMNDENGHSIEVNNRGLDNISVTVYSVDDNDMATIIYTNGTDRNISVTDLETLNNYYRKIDKIKINSRNSTMVMSANSTAKMGIPDQNEGEDIVVVIKQTDGTLIEAHRISCQIDSSGGPEITADIKSGSEALFGKNCKKAPEGQKT